MRDVKEFMLERYLCYRALLLAILGKSDEAEALRWFIRKKWNEPVILQPRVEK